MFGNPNFLSIVRKSECAARDMNAQTADFAWFRDFLQKAVKEAGSQRKLADRIGASGSSVNDWLTTDALPGLKHFAALMEIKNGDVKRALPTYTPPSLQVAIKETEARYGKRPEPIRFVGNVTGGRLAFSSQQEAEEINFEDLWRRSPWWSYANKEEPIVLVEVRGDSMAPDYPDGCMIALRKPSDKRIVPNGAPCVFRQGGLGSDERTFKILRETKRGEIIGWPLNPEHDPVVFKRNEVDIEYVVLGVLNQRVGTDNAPGASLARRAVAQKSAR